MKKHHNKTVFVLGITADWVFAAATVLLGLKKHRAKPFDVLILHNGITDEAQTLLRAIVPCEFKYFDIKVSDTGKFHRVSKMTFSRFEIFSLLHTYSYAVWLDADVVITGSMDLIEDECKSGIAMFLHKRTPIRVSFSEDVTGFDMQRDCFNGGVIVVSDVLRDPLTIHAWLYQATVHYEDSINSDQAILNMMIQTFDLNVDPMTIAFNCHPGKFCRKPSIIHPWGEGKFWNYFWNKQWNEYYLKWLGLGGHMNNEYESFKKRLGMKGRIRQEIKMLYLQMRDFLSIVGLT